MYAPLLSLYARCVIARDWIAGGKLIPTGQAGRQRKGGPVRAQDGGEGPERAPQDDAQGADELQRHGAGHHPPAAAPQGALRAQRAARAHAAARQAQDAALPGPRGIPGPGAGGLAHSLTRWVAILITLLVVRGRGAAQARGQRDAQGAPGADEEGANGQE